MDEYDVRVRFERMKAFLNERGRLYLQPMKRCRWAMAELRCDWDEIEGAIRRSANRKRIVSLGNVAPYGAYDMDGDEMSDGVVLPFKRSNK